MLRLAIAGGLSAALLVAVVLSGLGFLFLFLPTLPLFWIGLSEGARQSLAAGAVAGLALALVAGPSSGLLFFLTLALPVSYISRYALAVSAQGWFPLGHVFTRLAGYGGLFLAVMALFYAGRGAGLEQALGGYVSQAIADSPPEYAEVLAPLAGPLAFLVLPVGIWMWVLLLYAHGWIAHRLLVKKGRATRPDFGIAVFEMPGWTLFFLAVSALAAVIGSPGMAFIGKAVLMSLMLPYFLLGIARLHEISRPWPNRRFFLFFVYLLLLTQLWPVLLVALAGLFYHIKRLSARLN